MWNKLATWVINITWVLSSFAVFTLIITTLFSLSVEATLTVAGLLTISLSDLDLGRVKK